MECGQKRGSLESWPGKMYLFPGFDDHALLPGHHEVSSLWGHTLPTVLFSMHEAQRNGVSHLWIELRLWNQEPQKLSSSKSSNRQQTNTLSVIIINNYTQKVCLHQHRSEEETTHWASQWPQHHYTTGSLQLHCNLVGSPHIHSSWLIKTSLWDAQQYIQTRNVQ